MNRIQKDYLKETLISITIYFNTFLLTHFPLADKRKLNLFSLLNITTLTEQSLMLKLLTTSTLLIFTLHFSFASIALNKIFRDTTITPNKEYAINKEEFLNIYGRDDSSRALIGFYFAKRNKGKKMIVIPTAISGGIAALAIIGAIAYSNSSSNTTTNVHKTDVAPPFPLLLLVILCPIIPFAIMGIRLRTKYSPKKLLFQLNNYDAGKPIPRWIAKSRFFKTHLKNDAQQ
jgi:hypothetical protein